MTPKLLWVWVAVSFLCAVVTVVGVNLYREGDQLRAINGRLDQMEEEAFAFPGSSTWQWRQHIDESIAQISTALFAALRITPSPKHSMFTRTPTRLLRTPTISPDAALITTPFLIGMASDVLRGIDKAHPTWSRELKRRYAAAAVAQYLSAHGGIPSAVVVNRLLDEAMAQLSTSTPEEPKR